jgi:hypothetical protein
LELDHKDHRQKVSHTIWSWSMERRDAELAKCQVLCHDCHLDKTNKEGSRARGERMGTAKLTEAAVREIRERQAQGESKRGLARDYGVTEKLVRLICSREAWKHI